MNTTSSESFWGRPRKWALAPSFLLMGLLYSIMHGPDLLRIISVILFAAGLVWVNVTYNNHIQQLELTVKNKGEG